MRCAVVTIGSVGDLFPFLAIARQLVRRGHEVHFLSQAPYSQQVRAEGVEFFPVVDEASHRRALEHPLLWHPLLGFGVLWRYLAVPSIEATVATLGELSSSATPSDPLLVLASPLAVGARIARERWPSSIRLISGYTAPFALRHVDDPMFLGSWQVPRWVSPRLRLLFWRVMDAWKLDPLAKPTLDRVLRTMDLPATTGSVFGSWIHSPDAGLALYPESFAAVPTVWKERRVQQADFVYHRPAGTLPLNEEGRLILEEGSRFALIYPGSAGTKHANVMLNHAVPACLACGLRPVVLAPNLVYRHLSRGIPHAGEHRVVWLGFAPIDELLRRATAFIHHGGIGSVAQGLLHRVPQLILPSAYDQFENATRLVAMSAGRWVPLQQASTPKLIQALKLAVDTSSWNNCYRNDNAVTPGPVTDATVLCSTILERIQFGNSAG